MNVKTYFSLSTGFRSLLNSRRLTHLSTSTLFLKNALDVIVSYDNNNDGYKLLTLLNWIVLDVERSFIIALALILGPSIRNRSM